MIMENIEKNTNQIFQNPKKKLLVIKIHLLWVTVSVN